MEDVSAQRETNIAGEGHNLPMRVEMIAIGQLKSDPDSPRLFSNRQLKAACRIIRQFGVQTSIGIDNDNRVLIGEIIFQAARELGIDALPAVRIDHLNRLNCQALSIAYARLGELGEFDKEKLSGLMLRFEVELPNFELEDLGFDTPAIDMIIAPEEQDNVLLPPLSATAVSRVGDLWKLGRHRFLCGDARLAESYALLMGAVKANAVFTDPPFGCSIDGFVSTRGKHREFAGGTSGMSETEAESLFTDFNRAMAPHLAPGAAIYEVIDWRSLGALLEAGTRQFGKLANLAVWAKDRPGQGSFLRSQHELILIFRARGGKLRNNVQLGRYGRSRSNLWHYPSGLTSSKGSDEGNILEHHPTPKPVRLVSDALLDTTRRGDSVLDPFMGSGTTLIAAEKIGRTCFGIELDPIFADLTIRRFQAWSGVQVAHAVTGELFDERASMVEAGVAEDRGEGHGKDQER